MAKQVLIIASDGFEQSELLKPREALEAAGIATTLASPESGEIKGWNHTDWGDSVKVDKDIEDVRANDYDAILVPGGQINPDKLRMNRTAVELVHTFFTAGKTVAAICHGPWLLAEADVLAGRTVTSWPSIRTDLRNAGANVVDKEVVVDGNLITSRKPDDIPAFSKAIITAVNETVQA